MVCLSPIHGSTSEKLHLLYYRFNERGIWFILGIGIGILGGEELKAMREIVDTGK